jgi:predicted transcriptional regulator
MRYRSRLEVIGSILRIVRSSSGTSKTRIMYGSYISSNQLKDYLGFALERGLLVYDEGTRTYRLTEKGQRFLNISDRVQQLLGLAE